MQANAQRAVVGIDIDTLYSVGSLEAHLQNRASALESRLPHPPHVSVLVKPSFAHPTYRSPDPPKYFTHSPVEAPSTEVCTHL
ncbi:hypothetical protein PMIN07_002620 [Paraphaeosphaeria minitans]